MAYIINHFLYIQAGTIEICKEDHVWLVVEWNLCNYEIFL